MKRICCFALALGLPLGAINAQETPTLAPGARVRVTNEEHLHVVRVVGTLESIDSSTIIVRRDDGDTMNVPRQPGTQLEVSGGPGSCSPDRSRCVILGLMGGVAVGVLAGLPVANGRGCNDEPCGLIYLLTVPAGALVGTIVGAVVGGDHWEGADLPAHLSVGPDGSRGLRLGLTLRF